MTKFYLIIFSLKMSINAPHELIDLSLFTIASKNSIIEKHLICKCCNMFFYDPYKLSCGFIKKTHSL